MEWNLCEQCKQSVCNFNLCYFIFVTAVIVMIRMFYSRLNSLSLFRQVTFQDLF